MPLPRNRSCAEFAIGSPKRRAAGWRSSLLIGVPPRPARTNRCESRRENSRRQTASRLAARRGRRCAMARASSGILARKPTPENGARVDSRRSHLYAAERGSIGPVGAVRLLVKSWPFIAEHRRLVYLKCALAFSSLTFFLLTPWPLKIVIDNVIDGRRL